MTKKNSHKGITANLSHTNITPGISSLKGQGRFHFEKGTSIQESLSQWENFEGATRPRPGATEVVACVFPSLKPWFNFNDYQLQKS